jgi:ABC-2 type transport system ATP-binding protein
MRDQGATILISSHILTELEGFCTSIGIMEKGRLVRSGRIEDVTAAESPAKTVEMRWVTASPSQVRSLLSQFAEVSQVDLATDEGTFSFAGSDERLAEILAAIVSAQVRLVSFNKRKTTVEELYMKLSHHEVM